MDFLGMDFFADVFWGMDFLFFGGAAHLKVRVSDVEIGFLNSLVVPLIVLMLFKAQGN